VAQRQGAVVGMNALEACYRGRSVLVTGHTGFKGSWMVQWLAMLGARVSGYALAPPTRPSMFELCGLETLLDHRLADIRDDEQLDKALAAAQPEVIFHMAAQSLVRRSYDDPIETLDVNAMGTAKVLEAVRRSGRPCAVVVVTSDKCYANNNWVWGYRENDPMGGADPYSMSKGAAELVADSWRQSYFRNTPVRLASARAGNVIGGGDWAQDRIVTDCVEALIAGRPIEVRNPLATRPWQHVLEPLSGYLWLGQSLLRQDGDAFAEGWNFGPSSHSVRNVQALVDKVLRAWGAGEWRLANEANPPKEAMSLALNCDKAAQRLRWFPVWDFDQSVNATVDWYKAWNSGQDAGECTRRQIGAYVEAARDQGLAWAAQAE
jgi:CDP-glucose 4,6-dehydratase